MKNKEEDAIFEEEEDQNDNFPPGHRQIHSMENLFISHDYDDSRPAPKVQSKGKNKADEDGDWKL